MGWIDLIPCNKINHQNGFILMMALGLMVLIGLTGMMMTSMATYDVKQSRRDFDHKKAHYLSETALNWGLSVSKINNTFYCVTHDSTGNTKDTTGGPDCGDKVIFLNSDNAWYSGTTPQRDSLGWITNSPTNSADALSGDSTEILSYKIWFPTSTTVRILGKGLLQGKESSINLFGTR